VSGNGPVRCLLILLSSVAAVYDRRPTLQFLQIQFRRSQSAATGSVPANCNLINGLYDRRAE
jgi:hypothetical protein